MCVWFGGHPHHHAPRALWLRLQTSQSEEEVRPCARAVWWAPTPTRAASPAAAAARQLAAHPVRASKEGLRGTHATPPSLPVWRGQRGQQIRITSCNTDYKEAAPRCINGSRLHSVETVKYGP